MKKTLMSMALGLVLATVPVAIFAKAACADLITTSNGLVCTLTGSSTTPSGVTLCSYKCVAATAN
jgi:hypothetical protein